MQQVKWAEFELQELFESSNGDFDIQKVHINNLGNYVITAGLSNNGIIGKTDVKAKIFEANTITVDMFGNAFYRQFCYKMVTHARVFSLKTNFGITQKQGMFFVSALHFLKYKFGYENMCSWAKVKSEKISLPIKPNSNLAKLAQIDFDFMENFIAQLEAFRLSQLEAYLLVTGLKNYTLTAVEQQALADFENGKVVWGEYKVVDLFDVKNTKNILSRDVVANSGHTPYLSASRENNAVSSYISYNEDLLDKGDCIFIGGKTFVVTYQGQDFYSNDSHNLTLYLKDEPSKTKLNQLFMVSCIYKSLGKRYSWGDSISNKKIQTDWVTLPTNNQQPDYSFMEILISAVQKLVIKDVVLYADRKIAATRQVIEGD